MGLKIDHCGTPKSIFRRSRNSKPALILFSFIEICRNKGQRPFIETE